MGKTNMIQYGDITVASDLATLDEVKKVLDAVIKKHGYPDSPRQVSAEFEEDLAELDDVIGKEERKWSVRGGVRGEEDNTGDGQ